MEKRERINKLTETGIRAVLAALIVVQLFLCICMMIKEGDGFQLFEESIRYVNGSYVFKVNGWELIGYPLFLAFVRRIFGVQYVAAVGLIQLLVTGFTLFYFMKCTSSVLYKKEPGRTDSLILIGYILTNPFVFQFVIALLPDILSLDVFLITLCMMLNIIWGEKRFLQYYVIGTIGCVLLQGLLYRNYQWVSLIFLMGISIIGLLLSERKDGYKRGLKFGLLAVGIILAATVAFEVNHVTTDYSGHMKYSLVANLTERFVYPHIEEDYKSYPGLVKGSMSKDIFLSNADKMYHLKEELAPKIEQEYGKHMATRIYFEMIKTGLLTRTKEIAVGFCEDLFYHFTQMFTAVKIIYHNHDSRYGYNISRIWDGTSSETIRYFRFGAWAQLVVGVLSVLKLIWDKFLLCKKENIRGTMLVFFPTVLVTVLATLFAPQGADYRTGLVFMLVLLINIFSNGGKMTEKY